MEEFRGTCDLHNEILMIGLQDADEYLCQEALDGIVRFCRIFYIFFFCISIFLSSFIQLSVSNKSCTDTHISVELLFFFNDF